MPHQNKRETSGSKCSEKANALLETFRISNNVTVSLPLRLLVASLFITWLSFYTSAAWTEPRLNFYSSPSMVFDANNNSVSPDSPSNYFSESQSMLIL